MPFKNDKQRAFLFAQKPDVADKFVAHSGKDTKKEAIKRRLKRGNNHNQARSS